MFELSPLHTAATPSPRSMPAPARTSRSKPSQPDDVLLLRSELVIGVNLVFTDLFAGGEQFTARAFSEGFGADRGEQVVGGT